MFSYSSFQHNGLLSNAKCLGISLLRVSHACVRDISIVDLESIKLYLNDVLRWELEQVLATIIVCADRGPGL